MKIRLLLLLCAAQSLLMGSEKLRQEIQVNWSTDDQVSVTWPSGNEGIYSREELLDNMAIMQAQLRCEDAVYQVTNLATYAASTVLAASGYIDPFTAIVGASVTSSVILNRKLRAYDTMLKKLSLSEAIYNGQPLIHVD